MASGRSLFRAVAISLVTAIFLIPIAFLIVGSLRRPGLPPTPGFEWVPDAAYPSNYRLLPGLVPIWSYLRNSLIVVAVAVPVTVVIASLTGFAIATGTQRARRFLIAISAIAFCIPLSALWVPRFVIFKSIGLTGTLIPLMMPALMATTPFFVFIYALTYSRLPRSLYDAAQVEGLGVWATWRKIAWPLGKPATAAVVILAFIFHWSNFVDPLLYLSDEGTYTLPLGLRILQTLDPTLHPIFLAGAAVATVPALIAFAAIQKRFFDATVEVRG